MGTWRKERGRNARSVALRCCGQSKACSVVQHCWRRSDRGNQTTTDSQETFFASRPLCWEGMRSKGVQASHIAGHWCTLVGAWQILTPVLGMMTVES